jgi:hypothetical protein
MSMPDSVEIGSSRDLLQKIEKAQKLPRFESLAALREIGEKIEVGIGRFTTVELTGLSDTYSKAFVPIGVKPNFARQVTQLILRAIDRANDDNSPRRIAGLPRSEYSPHPAGIGLADLLESAMGGSSTANDGRVRPDLAG